MKKPRLREVCSFLLIFYTLAALTIIRGERISLSSARENDMPSVGTVFFFGYRKTPNVVTRVIPMKSKGAVALVYLKGPRGGESRAFVRPDGSCRKI